MGGSNIYQSKHNLSGQVQIIFLSLAANRPDAIGRKVDAGRKKHSKIAIFSRFLKQLTTLYMKYRIRLLIQAKAFNATPFGSDL
jgi:hypothetical protein